MPWGLPQNFATNTLPNFGRCTLTRASRRLQKSAIAAPLDLSRFEGEVMGKRRLPRHNHPMASRLPLA